MHQKKLNRVRVVAVIPAHNEERTIGHVICDLARQTYPLHKIVIVADNCTDNTVWLVRWFCERWFRWFPKISLMETVGNTARKAGAINQALAKLEENIDYVFLMDADTRLDSRAIEVAVRRMESDKTLGAVCSKAGVLPFRGETCSLAWLLHRLQRLEYAMFDSQRVETLDTIKVVHGMAALHRWQALRQVGFYDEGNLVEDYELTIRYRERGWNVTMAPDMLAWTKVPTKLRNLWHQRLRWLRGGVDTLREHGWNSATRKDILQHILGNLFLLTRGILTIWFMVSVVQMRGHIRIHTVVLFGMGICLLNMLYRMRYVENPTLSDWIIRLTLLPEQIYGHFQTAVLYWAYVLSFLKLPQNW